MKQYLREIIFLLGKDRRKLIGLLTLFLMLSLLELMGIGLIGPYFSVVIEHEGETLDREFLVENLRGITWQSYDRSVDVLVSRLRSKLGETPNHTRFIKTVHGVGYKFIGEPKD